MDDHNLNSYQLNKWKQLVKSMGETNGNVAMYNWVESHLTNKHGFTEKDLEGHQQEKLKELRSKIFNSRSSEEFCKWMLGEKVATEALELIKSITHDDGGNI